MIARLSVLPAALVALLALWPAHAKPQDAAPRPPRPERFQGVWRIEQSRTEARGVVNQAIERCVSAMNFFVRGIARTKLRDGTPVHDRIDLEFRGDDRVTVRFEGREGYTTRLGQTERRRNPNGQEMRVTQRFRPNGHLEQEFATDDGTRWYVYMPLRDGRLRVKTTTGSPRMPQPMWFLLDYHRN